MNLENLSVQGMNTIEMKSVDGGNQPMSSYMTQESIQGLSGMIGDFCRGFGRGFMSCF